MNPWRGSSQKLFYATQVESVKAGEVPPRVPAGWGTRSKLSFWLHTSLQSSHTKTCSDYNPLKLIYANWTCWNTTETCVVSNDIVCRFIKKRFSMLGDQQLLSFTFTHAHEKINNYCQLKGVIILSVGIMKTDTRRFILEYWYILYCFSHC